MTWSISASGKKASAIETVKNASASFGDHQEVEKREFERAKVYVLETLEGAPDAADVNVSCSGHTSLTPPVEGTERKHAGSAASLSVSYWVTEDQKADPSAASPTE